MKKSFVSLCVAVLLAVCLVGASGAAEFEKMTIRLGHPNAATENEATQFVGTKMSEYVKAATNGAVVIEVYGGAQLGAEADMLEGLKMGTMDMAIITNAYISSMAPKAEFGELPFIYDDYEMAHKVLDGGVFMDTVKKDVLENLSSVLLGYCTTGFRHTWNNTRAINTVADFKGIKLRVMETPIFIRTFNLLGSSPTPMAYSEVFTALQQGTVDGMDGPISTTHAGQFYKVTKYFDMTNHTLNTNGVLVNNNLWNRMSPELQKIMQDAADDAIAKERELLMNLEGNLISEIEASGVAVNRNVNLDSMREAVAPMYDEYRETLGAEYFDAAMADLEAARAK